tara:strand:- start:49 stop:960 length:912 start_codon:yes stop_codon:yes gene_type:complete
MNKNALRLIAELHKEIQAYKVAGAFEDAVKDKKFKNPNTGNDVSFGSLPAEEQKKLREEFKKSQEKDSDKGDKGKQEAQKKLDTAKEALGKSIVPKSEQKEIKGWLKGDKFNFKDGLGLDDREAYTFMTMGKGSELKGNKSVDAFTDLYKDDFKGDDSKTLDKVNDALKIVIGEEVGFPKDALKSRDGFTKWVEGMNEALETFVKKMDGLDDEDDIYDLDIDTRDNLRGMKATIESLKKELRDDLNFQVVGHLNDVIDAEAELGEKSSKKAYLNDLLKEIEYNQIRVDSLGRKVAYLKVGSSK